VEVLSSNASTSAFLIVMAVTDPDVSPYKGMSMFLVPTDTPGVNIERHIGLGGERLGEGHHTLIHYKDVRVQGSVLADKQFVQGYIADSYAQLTQFRLLVLYTAWSIDKHKDYRKVRKDIATVKVVMPGVLHDIAQRALQVHGALGASNEMPFHQMILGASVMGIADGPTEVHKVTVARQVLRDYSPSDDLWPTQHIPKRLAAARAKHAEYLEHEVGNQ
jgi:acyl-CoA dehydrogenase